MSRALVFLVLTLPACAPPNSRAISPDEVRFFGSLDDVIDAWARESGEDGPAEVAAALRGARTEGRLRLFHEDQGDHGAIRGTMVAGTIYVHEAHALSGGDPAEHADELLASLCVYYHEGVHLTQSWLRIVLDTSGSEEEAYRETHRLQAWLLGHLLAGDPVPDLGLSSVPPDRLLAAYANVHQAFAQPEVGDRCEERMFDRIETEFFDGEGDRDLGAFHGRIHLLDVDFAPAGEGGSRAVLRIDREWPEELVNELTIPSRGSTGGSLLWRGDADFLGLLPGWSDSGRIESAAAGFYLAAPPGGANRAEAWNLGSQANRPSRVDLDGIEYAIETEGPPGRWRLAFAPFYVLSFGPEDLAPYRPGEGEGPQAPRRLAALQRRVVDRKATPASAFVFYDRQPRRTRLLGAGRVFGLPAAVAVVEWSGPDSFRRPGAPGRGYALPGWRPYDRFEPGFDASWGRALDAEVIWDPRSRARPPKPPYAFLPLDRRHALVLVDPADFVTAEPAYRIAVAYGE